MKRLLFLIADTGGGHRAAANAVSRYLAANAAGEFDVRIVDPFAVASPRMVNRTAHLYGPLTRHARWLWGGLYHATNSLPAMSLLERSLLRMVSPGMRRLLSSFDPDVVELPDGKALVAWPARVATRSRGHRDHRPRRRARIMGVR